jgi:N-acetylglucosaminyldiphosphoundecaprenol N-acetyl-beta-D-mannosaminyltransferase
VKRVGMGPLGIDAVTFAEALDVIEALVRRGEGGTVFTPNVDHVVLASEDARLRAAYADASLSLVDGVPVVWSSRLLGTPLPEKISGSDLVEPLMERAAARGWRVYFLGGAPAAAEKAKEILRARLPSLEIVGIDSPRIDMTAPPGARREIVTRLREARPDLVLVALGAPKQEIFSHEVARDVKAVFVGVGASLDFIAGLVPRAPKWMSKVGLEWLYRLAKEPRRLASRYLLRDPKFLIILLHELRRTRLSSDRSRKAREEDA